MTPWSLALVLAAATRTLVLPFDSTADPPSETWRGSAFEEAISAHLMSAGKRVVGVAERNRHLGEMGFLPGEPLTRATALVLARELGADRVIVGRYREGEDGFELTARLIDIERGATIGIVEDFGNASELRMLASQVAKNLFRLERDEAPAGFDACVERRQKLRRAAIEASARARLSLDPDEQARLLEEALTLSPSYLEARLLLGRLFLEQGRSRDAIHVLAHAEGEDGLYRAAYFDLGVAYLEERELEPALEIFRTLSAQEGSPAQFNNLGVALLGTADLAEAMEAFESAYELGGGAPTYAFNLGWSYWRSGKGALALQFFEEAAEADPLDAEARLLLSAALASQAKAEEAASTRAQALLLSPPLEEADPATAEGWARAVGREGAREPVSALPVPGAEVVDAPFLAELLDARSLRVEGRLDEAVRAFQRSLYRNPSATDLRRELAELYVELGELDKAASELSVVLWSDPSAEGHVALARVYVAMDEPLEAREELELALELDPEHGEALELRAEIGLPDEEERESQLR